MAIVLMRKTGFAWSSNPYGITDPKGNPCCLRESVERLPVRPRYNKVRARSANVGSATASWLLAAPEPACFPVGNEDIAFPPTITALASILELTLADVSLDVPSPNRRCGPSGHFGDYARVTTHSEIIPRKGSSGSRRIRRYKPGWRFKS